MKLIISNISFINHLTYRLSNILPDSVSHNLHSFIDVNFAVLLSFTDVHFDS